MYHIHINDKDGQ